MDRFSSVDARAEQLVWTRQNVQVDVALQCDEWAAVVDVDVGCGCSVNCLAICVSKQHISCCQRC